MRFLWGFITLIDSIMAFIALIKTNFNHFQSFKDSRIYSKGLRLKKDTTTA